MAFVRPTLTRSIARAKSDIETRLPGADAKLRRTVEFVLARVVGGATHGLHGHLVWVSRQLMVDTAVDELMVRWADIWGLERTAAVKATGTVAITGVDTTVCPAGTLWQTADEVVYEQDASVTIGAGAFPTTTAEIDVTAVVGGDDGNQVAGVTLTLVSPIAGIDSDGTVDADGLTGGTDQETLAALLARLLLRLQNPPKGGGPGDYVNWALEVSGCTRAWELANANGLGTVAIYFVQDNDTVSIIPTVGEITTMQTHIDSKAPITADPTVAPPTEDTFTMSITLVPNTPAVRTAVDAELDDLILQTGNPATGADLLLSKLDEAISLATGETDHTITLINTVTPVAAGIVHAVGHIPKRGAITYS
jgi:uncharacterized phage protein gp47/JayE